MKYANLPRSIFKQKPLPESLEGSILIDQAFGLPGFSSFLVHDGPTGSAILLDHIDAACFLQQVWKINCVGKQTQ